MLLKYLTCFFISMVPLVELGVLDGLTEIRSFMRQL